MAERDTLVNKQRINYTGLFDAKGLFKLIDSYFEKLNYDKVELKNIEVVKPTGKFVDVEIEPYKAESDYSKSIISVRMIMSDLKQVEIEKEGMKIKVNQGKLELVFDAQVETDYENRWESKPVYFFIRTLFNKYFLKPYTKTSHSNCASDLEGLVNKIKAFLNVYRSF